MYTRCIGTLGGEDTLAGRATMEDKPAWLLKMLPFIQCKVRHVHQMYRRVRWVVIRKVCAT